MFVSTEQESGNLGRCSQQTLDRRIILFPFLRGIDTCIGNGLTIKLTFSNLWLYIGQGSSRGKCDEKHAPLVKLVSVTS